MLSHTASFDAEPTGTSWTGVRVRKVHRPAADVTLSAMAEHYLCINIGDPHHLTYGCNGRTHSALRRTGDLVLTPTDHDSRWRRAAPGAGMHVFVQPSFLKEVAASSDSNATDLEMAFCVPDPQTAYVGFALLAEAEQGCPGGRIYGDTLALALAVHLMRRYGRTQSKSLHPAVGLSPARLRRVESYLHDHLDCDLTLVHLADLAGLSPYHFARQFRLATGLSVHQYVIQRRVERAREMLAGGRVTAGEAAAAVGFADQSHLSRHFKRIVGVTPARFARG